MVKKAKTKTKTETRKKKKNRTTTPASPRRRGKEKKRNTRKYTFDLRSKRDRETGKKKVTRRRWMRHDWT